MSFEQNAVENNNIKTCNKSFERVVKLGTALIDQNFSYKETKSRMKLGSACYRLLQNLCLPIFYPKIQRLKYTELLSCMGVKLGHTEGGK
jgi:hypothetical protein